MKRKYDKKKSKYKKGIAIGGGVALATGGVMIGKHLYDKHKLKKLKKKKSLNESFIEKRYDKYLDKCHKLNKKPLSFKSWSSLNAIKSAAIIGGGVTAAYNGKKLYKTKKEEKEKLIPEKDAKDIMDMIKITKTIDNINESINFYNSFLEGYYDAINDFYK